MVVVVAAAAAAAVASFVADAVAVAAAIAAAAAAAIAAVVKVLAPVLKLARGWTTKSGQVVENNGDQSRRARIRMHHQTWH